MGKRCSENLWGAFDPLHVLLDPNGKIIAKKLRGAELEKELERLLGDKESR